MASEYEQWMDQIQALISQREGFGNMSLPNADVPTRYSTDETFRLDTEVQIAALCAIPASERAAPADVLQRMDALTPHEIEALNYGYVGDHAIPYWPKWADGRWGTTVETLESSIAECLERVKERNDAETKFVKTQAWREAGMPGTLDEWLARDDAGDEQPTREGQIDAAVRQVNPDHEWKWTKSGKPRVNEVEEILGWNISARERDEAWRRTR